MLMENFADYRGYSNEILFFHIASKKAHAVAVILASNNIFSSYQKTDNNIHSGFPITTYIVDSL